MSPKTVGGRLVTSALLVASMAASGCVLTRVNALQAQLCDPDNNFELAVDQGVLVSMREPVLLDTDITWLAGSEPSAQRIEDDVLTMRYVVRKDQPDSGSEFDIPVDLSFRRIGGQYRLEQARVDLDLRTVLDAASVSESLRRGCGVRPNLLAGHVEIDLADMDTGDLPTRDEILTILGPPETRAPEGDMLAYRYHLAGAGKDVPASHAALWFGGTGNALQRLEVRYLYYELRADFHTKKARLQVVL